jgi:uncharacterized membrane protein YccC
MAGPASPLLAFLRAELAPSPGRGRATARVLIAALAASVLVISTHLAHGHWLIFTIFLVSPEDAGGSIAKGLQRLAGTAVGGAAGILLAIAFANEPPFLFVAIGAGVALGMFLSRVTRFPYASLLTVVTLLMVGLSHLDSPGAEVETALWRTLMILIGVVLGTGAQVFVWPSDPEERLLDDLADRLATAEGLLRRMLAGSPIGVSAPGPPPVLALSGLAGQLDLLASAEVRWPGLRRRHPEQIALIAEVERLLTSALWLDEVLGRRGGPAGLDAPMRQRLAGLADACAGIRGSIAARRPAAGDLSASGAAVVAADAAGRDPGGEPGPGAGVPNLIAYLEATVGRIAAGTAFLGAGAAPRPGEPGHSPLDTPARPPFFTAASPLASSGDLKFALKCALAVEICLVAILGLDWPGLLTSAVTCVIVAQSTLGASLTKSLLRLAGAAVGGLLGLTLIAAVHPNAETLAALLPALAVGFGIAAWVTAGSSRIAYAGIQIGMAFGICAVDVFGPTTDLVPPRDRLLGIMLGVTVMGLIHGLIWPERASRAMRSALAAALRAMADLADVPPAPRDYLAATARAARHRAVIYRALASVLRLREEARMEPGAQSPGARAERDRILTLTGEAQAVFLALLALARHRLARTAVALPAELADRAAAFHQSVRRTLESMATALAVSRDSAAYRAALPSRSEPSTDLEGPLADLERNLARSTESPEHGDVAVIAFLEGEAPIRRAVVQEMLKLGDAVRRDLPTSPA